MYNVQDTKTQAFKQDIIRIMYVKRSQKYDSFVNVSKDNENSILFNTKNLPQVFKCLGQILSVPLE